MSPKGVAGGAVRLVLVWCLALVLAGCGDIGANPALTDACRSVGLCDEPTPPPVVVDVLCDASAGSSCTRETLSKTLEPAISFAIARPGSRIRLWGLGRDVATTAIVGEHVVPPSGHGGDRTRRGAHDRLADSAREQLAASAVRIFQTPPIRRSPIAEALTKVGLADAAGLARTIIAVTDGREVSDVGGDFECRKLPTDGCFLAFLHGSGVLGRGLLAGASVQMVFMEGAPTARGCAVRMDREVRIRALWTSALKAAGAADVRVTSGPPVFAEPELHLREGKSP